MNMQLRIRKLPDPNLIRDRDQGSLHEQQKPTKNQSLNLAPSQRHLGSPTEEQRAAIAFTQQTIETFCLSSKTKPAESINHIEEENMASAPNQPKQGELPGEVEEAVDQRLADCSSNFTLNDLKTSLEFTQAEVDQLREENKVMKKYLSDFELEIQRNAYAIQKVETKADKLELQIKKRNIILEGVHESETGTEDVHKVVCAILEDLQITRSIIFDQCYRIRAFNKRRTRPIFLSFLKVNDRDLVYSKRANLRHSAKFSRVWIAEDTGPNTRRTKNIVWQVTREARLAKEQCTSTPFTVTINGTKYGEKNFEDLPEHLSLEHLKTKKYGNVLAYHSEFSPFSNLYPARIIHKGSLREFITAEQAYQYRKCTELNQAKQANLIMLTREVYEMRQLGREAGTSEEWERIKEEVMYEILLMKFEQDEELQEKLLLSGTLELVEATPDKEWGAGCSLNSKAMKSHSWTGKNRQGIILMRVRSTLRKREEDKKVAAAGADRGGKDAACRSN